MPSDTHTRDRARRARAARRSHDVLRGPTACPTVGGTKNVDVDAVIALAPDLVIAQSRREHAGRARGAGGGARAGARVVAASGRRWHRPRRATGADPRRRGVRAGARAPAPGHGDRRATAGNRARAFVPIWMDPLMTINADTFGSDVLAHAGIANAFAIGCGCIRSPPISARATPRDASGRDLRYPRVTLDEVRARGADLIVLARRAARVLRRRRGRAARRAVRRRG